LDFKTFALRFGSVRQGKLAAIISLLSRTVPALVPYIAERGQKLAKKSWFCLLAALALADIIEISRGRLRFRGRVKNATDRVSRVLPIADISRLGETSSVCQNSFYFPGKHSFTGPIAFVIVWGFPLEARV
jgi:hypothetical protein